MKDEPNLSQHVFTEQTSPQWEVWPRVVSLHVRKVGAYTRDWKLKSTIRVSITAAPNSTEEIWQFSFAEISHR